MIELGQNPVHFAIVTNIVAAIVIWLSKRLTREAKNLFTSGTIQAKVRKIFSARRVAVAGSFIAAIFNLWILIKFVAGRSSFTRLELLAGIIFSIIVVFWINRLVAGVHASTERKLEATQERLAELEQRPTARSLTFEQNLKLSGLLKSIPQSRLTIRVTDNDYESRGFAIQFFRAFRDARWSCSMTSFEPNFGVIKQGMESEYYGLHKGLELILASRTTQEAENVQKSFAAIGLEVRIVVNTNLGTGIIDAPERQPLILWVGVRG